MAAAWDAAIKLIRKGRHVSSSFRVLSHLSQSSLSPVSFLYAEFLIYTAPTAHLPLVFHRFIEAEVITPEMEGWRLEAAGEVRTAAGAGQPGRYAGEMVKFREGSSILKILLLQ